MFDHSGHTQTMVNSIRNYIEQMLNTRRSYFKPTLDTLELEHSLLNYGLPDLRHFNLHSKNDIHHLCLLIESTIETHECRLKHVKVSVIENKDLDDHMNVLLCIKATLLHKSSEKEIEFFSEFNRLSQLFFIRDATS